MPKRSTLVRTKMATLAGRLAAVLATSGAREKAAAARTAAADWRAGRLKAAGFAAPPHRPGRPDRPELRPPRDMPKRGVGEAGRVALLHALAHIELNAVDLAADIVCRFVPLDPADGLDRESWAENEFGGAPLGDKRLTRRLVTSAARTQGKPAAGVPRRLDFGARRRGAALSHARRPPRRPRRAIRRPPGP